MSMGLHLNPNISATQWVCESAKQHSVRYLRIYVVKRIENRLRTIDPKLLRERRFRKIHCIVDPILTIFFEIIYFLARLYFRAEIALLLTRYNALLKYIEQRQWQDHALNISPDSPIYLCESTNHRREEPKNRRLEERHSRNFRLGPVRINKI